MQPQGARLWLVRHGETDWNAAGRVQGHTPTHLNDNGRQQAAELGRLLHGRSFAAIWSSDLPRASETAELLMQAANLQSPLQRSEQLRERSFGKYEGHTIAELGVARTALGLSQTGDLADWTGMPGVESNEALWDRISSHLRQLSDNHPGEDVIVVTHGGVIARVVYRILGIPDGTPRHFPLSNGIVAIVQWRKDAWYLLSLLDLPLAMGSGITQKDTSRSQ